MALAAKAREPPTFPVPEKVAPAATVTALFASEPVSLKVPALTAVEPV